MRATPSNASRRAVGEPDGWLPDEPVGEDGELDPAVLRALGSAARELRARLGFSQESLGHRCGLHRNYVGSIERGEQNVTFRVLLKLVSGLGVPLSELVVMYERNRMRQLGILPPLLPGPWSGSVAAAGPSGVVDAGGPEPRAPRPVVVPPQHSHADGEARVNGPGDTAALLMLCGLLAWRLASVLLRAAGLLCLWGGAAEIATGTSPLLGAGALALGTLVWIAGRRLEAYCRCALRTPRGRRTR